MVDVLQWPSSAELHADPQFVVSVKFQRLILVATAIYDQFNKYHPKLFGRLFED